MMYKFDLDGFDSDVFTLELLCDSITFNATFTWDSVTQRNYNELLDGLNRMKNATPLYKGEVDIIPCEDYLDYAQKISLFYTAYKANDIDAMIDAIDNEPIAFAQYQNFLSVITSLKNGQVPSAGDPFIVYAQNTALSYIDLLEAKLWYEEQLYWSVNLKRDDDSRNLVLRPNGEYFKGDLIYQMYVTSTKETIGRNDLGFVSLYIELL